MGSGFWLVSRALLRGCASLAPRGERRVGDKGGEGISCEHWGAGAHVHVVHCRIGRHSLSPFIPLSPLLLPILILVFWNLDLFSWGV